MKYLFFDNASTTRCCETAVRLVQTFASEEFGNPSSSHIFGQLPARAIRESRLFFAKHFKVDPEQVIFTGSGTEADNLAVYGVALANRIARGSCQVIASSTEHPAVRTTVQSLGALGIQTWLAPVDEHGQIRVEELEAQLSEQTALVSIHQVNNIVGTLLPVEELATRIKRRAPRAVVHTDAVQAFGKVQLPQSGSAIDLISISAHKVGGPKGIGALIVLNPSLLKTGLRPLVWGGGQEGGFRSGSQSAGLIAAFHAAAELTLSRQAENSAKMAALSNLFRKKLIERKLLSQGPAESSSHPLVWNSPERSVPHIVNLSVPGFPSSAFAKLLEERGCLISTGSACSSQKAEPDAVLQAMGRPIPVCNSAIRVSFGSENTEEEVDQLVHAIDESLQLMRKLLGIPQAMILLRYHEIAVKGANRGWFEERLSQNVRKLVCRALGDGKVRITRSQGRLFLHAPWEPQVKTALTRVFGLTGFSPARTVATDLPSLTAAALEEFDHYVRENGVPKTFRVTTRRSQKSIPETSTQIDREIGSKIHDAHSTMSVALNRPEVELGIEVRDESSYMWMENLRAHGGLPVGTNAPTLCLVSGGIDSPIAAIRILRRGSACHFLHFHGAPFVGEESLQKVEDLIRTVNRFQPDPKPLHFVRFGKIQEQIALATQPKLRTILYRRMMLRIANLAARKLKLGAIVTGESLGQVASQTLENLSVINEASALPVLRPLIGFSKDEIIGEARKWGTFDISIRPAADCCTLFADRHPAIRSNLAIVLEQEKKFPVQELVEQALESIETRWVGYLS